MFRCCKADCAHGRKAVQLVGGGVVRGAIGVRSRASESRNFRSMRKTLARANREFFGIDPRCRHESRIRIGARAGAKWISRGWIELKLPEQFPDRGQAIVVTCADGRQSVFAARALGDLGYKDVRFLHGGVQAWRAAGLTTETGLDRCLVQPNDVVLSPSIRGSKEDMQRYLDWELKLER